MADKLNSIIIDLSALVHNLDQIRKLAGEGTRIMGVVKADAYGHGLLPVSRTLEKNNIDCLGVAYLHEALELRKSGIKIPIVILGGIRTQAEAREVVVNDLIPVLYDLHSVKVLSRESARQGKNTTIHLNVDTGMGRLGVFHGEIVPFLQEISALKGMTVEGLISHLSSAEQCEDDFTALQIHRFAKAVEAARSRGFHLPFNSLANSAGIMAHKDARFEMVRTGIALYGGLPGPKFSSPVPLRPVMCFKGRIVQIRDLPDRTPVSYGRTFYTNGPRRIAIISAGYADGLPRSMSNAGNVIVRGKQSPLVGMICMNLSSSDVTGIEGVEKGDEAVFLGSQGGLSITGDDLAASAGTISYEVFCSLGRNKKEYLS